MAALHRQERIMETADVIFIVVTLAFFALCVAYVRGLDRIVRAAEEADATHEGASR
jgi:hypothetical protein